MKLWLSKFNLFLQKKCHFPAILYHSNSLMMNLKKEELGRGSFGSTAKARFKGETVTMKKNYWKQMWWNGEIFWKRHKYWKVSITLIYLISKMYVTSHSHLRLKMFYLVFPRLKQLVKSVDWMGFQGFSIIFRLKWWSSYFSKNKFRCDSLLQFLHNNGIAHRDLKPAKYTNK